MENLLCPDPRRAEQNRQMVARHENTDAYQRFENWLRQVPFAAPLPAAIPTDELPRLDKHADPVVQ